MEYQIVNCTNTEKYFTYPYPCDRISSPKLEKKKIPFHSNDKQYEKFCRHLNQPPIKLSLKGSLNSKSDLISGHLVSNLKKPVGENLFSPKIIKSPNKIYEQSEYENIQETETLDIQFLKDFKHLPEEEKRKKKFRFAQMLRKILAESKIKWLKKVHFLSKEKEAEIKYFGTYAKANELFL